MSVSLFTPQTKISVPGKAILIGEHAAVYGYPAIAGALPGLTLTLHVGEDIDTLQNWSEAWEVTFPDKKNVLTSQMKNSLTEALENALKLQFPDSSLIDFKPQPIRIDSSIPLGGGMGSSAALSVALTRLISSANPEPLTLENELHYSNKIDSLFHAGIASGLDTTTIIFNSLISYTKNKPIEKLHSARKFWLAFVDSKERSDTSDMIKHVQEERRKDKNRIDDIFLSLGEKTQSVKEALRLGNIEEFGKLCSLAQDSLNSLGVSTENINSICLTLNSAGAIGSKLTGAGGGGMVFGVFAEKPEHLEKVFPHHPLFITQSF